MKLLIINTTDLGGAANACFRLQKGLQKKIDVKVLLANKQKGYENSFIYKNNYVKTFILKILSFIKYKYHLRNRSKELEIFSFPSTVFDITKSELYKEATIINFHWVSRFVDYNFFTKNKKPVVWTLHDMNPFSGGEHYDEEYLGIDSFGYPVKRKLTKKEISLFKKNIARKAKILSKVNNLTIVTPSEWLAAEARKSPVFKGKEVICIPNGLNSEIYLPRHKESSRELLNIPKEKKVILFVADSITNNRKGISFLKKSLEQITDPNLILCAIGENKNVFEKNNNIIELGSINDEILLSHAYSAADVFVIPSLMDNLPNTVLESLFCGTPVIGFPIGGIPDMVQDGVNGFLTENISVESLTKTIYRFLENPNYFNKTEIRENALKKYDQDIQVNNYIKLFNKILQ